MQQYEVFMNSLRSPATKRAYGIYFRRYEEFMNSDDLFCQNNPRLIEQKIIEFIVSLREMGLSYSAIHNYVMTVISFYKINDVMLNTTKISKFLPEYKKIKKDRAYTHEKISKLLEIADERMRAVILLLASTGMRIGAIPDLRLRNLEATKITIYEGTKEEYFGFITAECKKAVDTYLDMRSRYGEKLQENSFLIREQFDVRNPGKPKQTVANTLFGKLRDLSKRSGIRTKELPICHGFRKFFTTQLINSKVNPEIREMLLGHKIDLASAYYRPIEEEMFQEYEKAINNLTINEENRLRLKVEKLEVEKTEFEALAADIARIKKKVKIR